MEREHSRSARHRGGHARGLGAIKRRGFFGGKSKLAVGFDVWELGAGVSEGAHTHGGDGALEEVYFFQEG